MAVLDPGHADTVDRVEQAFPPERVRPLELHLDARDGTLRPRAVDQEWTTSYRLAHPAPQLDFTYRFDTDTEIIGTPVLTVWVSVEGHDDGDLFVAVQKLDRHGRQLWHQTVTLGLPLARRWMPILYRRGVTAIGAAFHAGPTGILRLSRRGLDPADPDDFPGLSLRQETRLTPGEPVEAEIPLWPTALRFHAGEQLRLRIAGRSEVAPELPGLPEPPVQPGDRHVLHTGGRYRAQLLLPTTPAGQP
jgi:predicted acyl esterase